MTTGKIASGTAFLLWAVVARRIEALIGEEAADLLLGDFRQFLSSKGFEQFASLVDGPQAQARANAILNQACNLFEQRITISDAQHLKRFARLSLRNVEEVQLALNAFTATPSTVTLEIVVRRELQLLHVDDIAAKVHLDEAVDLFMDCLELALVSQGILSPLQLKIDELILELKSNRQPSLPTAIVIESDSLAVTPEALFGREPVIDAIVKELDPYNTASSRVVMLYGPLGAGKSALARAASQRLYETKRFTAVITDNFQFNDKEDTLFDAFISGLEDRLGIKTIDGPVESRAQHLRKALQHQSLLYIVDDVEHDVTRRVVKFTQSLNAPTFRVLITQNTTPQQPECKTFFIEELQDIEQVRLFIQNRCGNILLDADQLKRILLATQGNLIALDELTKLFNDSGFEQILPDIEQVVLRRGSTIAEKWLGYVLSRLPMIEMLVIYAQCLFKRSSHLHMLIDIIRYHERESSSEGLKHNADVRKIRNAIQNLVSRSILVASPSKDGKRYMLKNTFLNYVRQELKDNDELEDWRIAWSKIYVDLRPRKLNHDDFAGWTIMIDYSRDGSLRVNPANPDEASTIRDAISYCISPNRIEQRWEDAAKLVESFRATLFAAGLWQIRIDACKAVIPYAERQERWHYVGQLQRLLAWMDCFRDQFSTGRDLADSAYKLSCQNLARSRAEIERIVHSQTMYKSLITLGHIALRQGLEGAISGHYLQYTDEQRADNLFRQAREEFGLARNYFGYAQMYVRHAFAGEELIVQYHLAEVEYYDRHTLPMLLEPRLRYDQLTYAYNIMEDVRKRAEDVRHERLCAHAYYYLGKALRRLATHRDLVDNSEQQFEKARKLLEKAQTIAIKYDDTILLGRIAFAFSQYYESLIPANVGRDNERAIKLTDARKYIRQAIKTFESDKMLLEKKDAMYFLEQRLGADE